MTNTFWVAVAAMTALAIAFLAYPLFFRSRAQQDRVDRHGQNLNNYRQRLAELEAEREAGHLDDASFTTLKEELDGSLLEDVGDSPHSDSSAADSRARGLDRRGMFIVALAGVVVLPIFAFTLYERWGASDSLAQLDVMRELQQNSLSSPDQVESLLTRLRNHLEDNPDNADGWAMLGRTSMELERYEAAAAAYQQLALQLQDDAVSATAWGLVAQARYLASGRTVDASVEAAISAALDADPDEVNALGLLGIAAFEREDYRRAAELWAQILRVAPDYPQYGSIANGIVKAYQRLEERPSDEVIGLLRRAVEKGQQAQGSVSGKGAIGQRGTPEDSVGKPSITVRVELSSDLPEPDPDATVFVFARAVEGPPMPLAAVRLKAGDLPAVVTLDDSAAMTPQARLSGADQVILGARVSRSGSATPGQGDLEGTSKPLEVRDEMGPVSVTINRVRP